jgi:hypothetical protein
MYGESHLKEFTLIHEIYNKFNYRISHITFGATFLHHYIFHPIHHLAVINKKVRFAHLTRFRLNEGNEATMKMMLSLITAHFNIDR